MAEQKPYPQITQTSFPHLIPALAALMIMIAVVIFCDRYATFLEDKYVNALAPLLLRQSRMGVVVQQAAFRQPDLLPVIGNSETVITTSQYGSFDFFKTYPTGFEVFTIGNGGNNSLNIAQDLAAVGSDLRGKKVVVSFTPDMFNTLQIANDYYAGNFSRLHAYALIFNPNLGLKLKQRAAVRMQDYPRTLDDDPLLKNALRNLAAGSFQNQFLYTLTLPLGQLNLYILRLQDHYAVWNYLQSNPQLNPVIERTPQKINWNDVIHAGEIEQKNNTNNNPYGIDNLTWTQKYHQVFTFAPPGSGDQHYITHLENSKEWVDLEIELDVLHSLGATPLVMSRPINGFMSTAAGISSQAQQKYYDKLESLAARYQMPLVDFHEYTTDPYFSIDKSGHSSAKGWGVVDQTLDAYFHGKIR